MNGEPGEVTFSLAHSNPATELFWHLDREYIGSTRDIHKMQLRPAVGFHVVTVVDGMGNSISREFVVSM
jgi:penicillin-binding protein 1C